jgi:hypothetical protein
MSMVRSIRWSLTAALLACSPLPVSAQLDQGRIVGTVADAQGAILPGVTIIAQSPSLIGTQTTTSEVDGQYRFPALPPGRYALVFELPGFKTLRRENIVLALGQTLTLDTALEISAVSETITVTSESPLVDIESTKTGVEFTAEKLAAVPSATDIWAVLGQAPGVRMTGFDVGGSHKSQQLGYESFGIRNQNRVVTEGVDTTEGTGGAGFYQDFFAHEEMSVSASGADVSMNTPGSAVVSSIKSGGNTFKSLNNITYEGERFVDNNIDDETQALGFTGQPNLLFWEGHTDVGGPVRRDRIWFYTAYNHFKIDKVVSGVARPFTDLAIFDNYTAKGTWRATDKDTAVGYYQWGRKYKPRRGLSATIGPDSILAQDSQSWMYNGQHQRVWTTRLFTDVKIGLFGFGWPMEPAVDFASAPPRQDTGTQVQTGAGWLTGDAGGPFTFERNKPQVNMTATYFLPDKAGSHDVKVGFEWADDQSRLGNNGNSGPILYLDRNGAVDEIRLTDLNTFETYGQDWTGPDNRNERYSLFAQDRWSPLDRLTVTIGLRWDRQRPYYEASIRKPLLTDLFPEQTVAARSFFTRDTVAPRLGVAYDVSGRGTSVVKAFYGRYYFNFADRLGGGNPGGTNRRDYKFTDPDGNRLYDGVHELGALVSSAGGSTTTVDPDLKTPYADEISVSFEQQFWGQTSARAAYVRKMSRDDFATYNVLREGQFTVPRDVTVRIQDFGDPSVVTQTFQVFDIPDALRGRVQNVIATIPAGVGGGDYNFDTIQFALNKRFPNSLFIQGSFDYQWRDELRANTASNSPLDSDPLNVNYFQNVFPAVPNRQSSTNWQGRLLARYLFAGGIGTAVNWRLQSGWAYARLVSVPLPNAGTQVFFYENIDANRSDMAALLDLRIDKSFRFGRYRLMVMGDLFNVTNSNAVTNFNLSNGANYGRINATLDPRTAMIGARFDF